MIRDSMSDFENINMIAIIFLQYFANGRDDVMTITMEADGFPPAVCKIVNNTDLNMTVTIETKSLMLRLTMPADVPGMIGWSRDTALIERIDKEGV